MKILRVASDLYPAVVGGVAIHSYDMSKDQAALGHDVTHYSCLADNAVEYYKNEKFRLHNLGRRFVIVGNTFCFNLLPLLSKTYKDFEIIHAHSHLYLSTFFCALFRRFHKYTLVITNHGLESQSVPPWFQTLYNRTFGRFILNSADCIISYTSEERDVMAGWGVKKDKIRIIHNGIKLERFKNIKEIPPKKKQILWVGRYVPMKGARYLIEGFAQFSKNHPEYSLLMIGKGSEMEGMKNLCSELSVSDKINMMEFIPNDKIQEKYLESEVFISSSLAEGVPKTMLEAMVCGLPVISTDLPQLIDIVDGCGIIIPTKDSPAIADALEKMVTSPDQMKIFGEASRKKVLENYDWADTVEKTTELFLELLTAKKSS